MVFQQCRWYDVYPRLAFLLKLVRLMPIAQQAWVGQELNGFLTRHGIGTVPRYVSDRTGNRWYDGVVPLTESLARLKSAPDPIKQQGTDFLFRLVSQVKHQAHCA